MNKRLNRRRNKEEPQRYLSLATERDIGNLCIFYDKFEDIDLSKTHLCVVGILEEVSKRKRGEVGIDSEKYKKHDTETKWKYASVIPVNVFIEFPNTMQEACIHRIKTYNKEKGEE